MIVHALGTGLPVGEGKSELIDTLPFAESVQLPVTQEGLQIWNDDNNLSTQDAEDIRAALLVRYSSSTSYGISDGSMAMLPTAPTCSRIHAYTAQISPYIPFVLVHLSFHVRAQRLWYTCAGR